MLLDALYDVELIQTAGVLLIGKGHNKGNDVRILHQGVLIVGVNEAALSLYFIDHALSRELIQRLDNRRTAGVEFRCQLHLCGQLVIGTVMARNDLVTDIVGDLV